MLITFFIFKPNYNWEYENHKIVIADRHIQRRFILQSSKGGEKATAVQKYPDRLEVCTEQNSFPERNLLFCNNDYFTFVFLKFAMENIKNIKYHLNFELPRLANLNSEIIFCCYSSLFSL